MVTMKSLIKRKFKPEYFPANTCIVSSEKQEKVQQISLDCNEEIIVTIDNEPLTNDVDCVVFTSIKIVIVKDDTIKSVYYRDIELLELPDQKIDSSLSNDDYKMNRSDNAKIHITDGNVQDIRIIYGGIYLLASLLKNPSIKEIAENKE